MYTDFKTFLEKVDIATLSLQDGKIIKKIRKEGDKHKFITRGYNCAILRNDALGILCGYVGLPKGHKLYGLNYNSPVISNLNVHGCVTFSGEADTDQDFLDKELWWIGFDCGHLMDFIPGLYFILQHMQSFFHKKIYRDLSFVRAELGKLAMQLDKDY